MQLVRLEDDGLLARDDVAGEALRRGRPAHHYTLTSAAEALYPKRYGDLTTELLGYLGGPDGEQVDELFERRRQRRVDGARPRLAHLSFTNRWPRSPPYLDEDGYLADATEQEDGSWLIVEHNCAILTVAHGFSQACSSELSFIREALPGRQGGAGGAHLMDGAHVCAYRVSPLSRRPARRRPARRRPAYGVGAIGAMSSTTAPSTSWISVRRSSTR